MLRLNRCLVRDERGIAATEFALILPILVILFLGVVETSNLLTADSRLRAATAAVADLVTQDPSDGINQADIAFYHGAARRIMANSPDLDSRFRVYITNFNIATDGTVTVQWVRRVGGGGDPTPTPNGACDPDDLPTGLRATTANDVVRVDGEYDWQPLFMPGWATHTLTATNFNMPRYSLQLPLDPNTLPDGC